MSGEEIEEATIDFENQKPAPDVEITDPGHDTRGVSMFFSSDENKLDITVQVTDRGGGIDELRLFQNNKLITTEDLDIYSEGETISRTYTVNLLSGINDIRITAFNLERTTKSENLKVAFTGEIQQVSNLYVLAVGINQYKKSSYNLNYAVPDVNAFVEGIEKGAKDIFGKVEMIKLSDSEATRQKISDAFHKLQALAKPTDVFVFYFAGHGSMSTEEKGKKPVFYLLPHEVTEMYNAETLAQTGIPSDTLLHFSRDIKAQKQLFILDACQSGGAVDMLANRGAAEERAIALLARSTGTYFLTASGSEQFGSEQFPVSYGFGQDFPIVVSGVIEMTDETAKPAGKYDAYSIEELEKIKKEAIENEEYETAADIRDEIKKREINR